MEIKKTSLQDAYLMTPKVFQDERGFFTETYSKKKLEDAGVIAEEWVQDNHSMSAVKGVLRGLHFQNAPYTQAKLVRVTKGSVYDVIVDLRKDSPTFGKWEGFTLTDKNFQMLFVPRGFAHGFMTLEDNTEFQYKCDNYYAPESEGGLMWNDSEFGIDWPIENPILSDKDQKHPSFNEFNSPF
ncbi:MAG: putative dTDP-4-dehydrorhamnose 3,5-epimerase [Candidatus Moranbacteria bacterium GW2011_GWC2_37_8]|nr:MAG: putative dTDP-4-dehydrorhamnose 3,5-epimerase [Candidatus Moranbacteria bacterium GW2011_GWC2_37_8]KKQ62280.1 MAG: putative dTDP-4-dehydrorhamnose 3,5-epimerase [Parcubacteria group bacterium GW2011_GWC1_38_22]KKQ81148.1 MAG: putative dTDP-4-dehydrorhamnose 3,5-epimerase [Candidatus Moranbacteria bacterium GW2011_GWD2_38_7]